MASKCIIIGGGIAGLSAGIAMRKAGYEVALYEQAPAIEPMGAALSIWGNAMAGLDWMGCGDAVRERAARIEAVQLSRRDGRALFGPIDVAGCDSFLPLRSDLQSALLEKLGSDCVHLGVQVDDASESDNRVRISANGQLIDEGNLLIAADGIHSRIGQEIIGGTPKYAGYGGALGLCSMPQGAVPPGLGHEIWAERERFGYFDAGPSTEGGQQYWFYMISGEEAEVTRTGKDALVARLKDWPEIVSATVAATPQAAILPIAIHAKPPPRRLGQGRIICIGDAAHPMEPNQGQGGCQGIEDAWALGVLASRYEGAELLRQFEKARLPRIRRAVRDSAMIGMAAHMKSSAIRAAVQGGFGITPRSVDQKQLHSRIAPPDYG